MKPPRPPRSGHYEKKGRLKRDITARFPTWQGSGGPRRAAPRAAPIMPGSRVRVAPLPYGNSPASMEVGDFSTFAVTPDAQPMTDPTVPDRRSAMRRLVIFIVVAGGVAFGLGMLARKLASND